MFHRYLVVLLFKLLIFRLAVPYFPPEVLLVRQHEKRLFRRFQRFAQLDMLLHILLDIILVLFSLKYVNEAA